MKKKLMSMLLAVAVATTGIMGTSAVYAADAELELFSDGVNPFTDGMSEASDFVEFEPAGGMEAEEGLLGEEILPEAEEEPILFEEAAPEEAMDAASAQMIFSDSNASITNAEPILVDTYYTDNNIGGVNWYKFALTEEGYVSLNFDHTCIDDGTWEWIYWHISLLTESQHELLKVEIKGEDIANRSMKIGLPEGTYYVKIGNGFPYNYSFKVNFTPSKVWEKEVNDEFVFAESINVNESKYGSLSSAADDDWYQFEIPAAGYVTVSFAHEYMENTALWNLYLYNDKKEEIAYSRSGSKDISLTSGRVGLKPGKYYLLVGHDYYISSEDYNFKINYNTSNVWETEFNEVYSIANTLKVNEYKYGTKRDNKNDNDWFKFTIPKDGYISLYMKHDYINSGEDFAKVYFYHSDMQELVSYSIGCRDTSFTGGKLGVPAGNYYVKVNPCSDKNYYKFKVNYFSSSEWETEFNDAYSVADSLKLNISKNGNIRSGRDLDWYKFKLSSKRFIYLNFRHSYSDTYYSPWEVHVYNNVMKEIVSFNISDKETSTLKKLGTLASGTYYVKVESSTWYHSDGDYTINVGTHTHSYKTYTTRATLTKNGKTYQKCSCGDVLSSSTIYHPEKITLGATTYTYNGKVRTPSVKVVASNGKTIKSSNYDLVYSKGRKNPGKYAVVIKFKGKYSGSVKKYFTIVKK